MSTLLLDTTVASLLHQRRANAPARARYEAHIPGNTLSLSFQSVAELWLWAEQNRWGTRARVELEIYIGTFLIIPHDEGLSRTWAQVMAACRRQGRRLEAADAWIAATAVRYDVRLLTHDQDFATLSLPGLNIISYA